MKKKLLLVIAIVAALTCLFAISVSAEHALKSQTTNAYGELSFFDDTITVGRTNTKYGFTPYMDAEGTTYARIVVGDGTTFYTFPTAYALSNTEIYGEGQSCMYVLDLSSLNSAMQTATGTNPDWKKANIYRIELPKNMNRVNGGNNSSYKSQNFGGYSNVIEIYLQPNTFVKDSDKSMQFYQCANLETIHNLDTFKFSNGSLGGSFQGCAKLTSLTIGVSTAVTKLGDNTFNGCSLLTEVNLVEAFPNLKSIGGKQNFKGCVALKKISSNGIDYVYEIPEGVTSIGQSAFSGCTAVKVFIFPSTLTSVGSTAFESCTNLQFVDFGTNTNDIAFDNYGHFQSCTSLKAVKFSDGITDLKNRIFAKCTSLEAVYLPANLVKINSNGNGSGAFCGASKVYFVQDKFDISVSYKSGTFDASKFTMPTKPSVYYMPSTFTSFTGHVIGGGLGSEVGSFFSGCKMINDVIVFGENFVNINSCNAFANISTDSSPKTIVFLGDISTSTTLVNSQYTSFVFANENDAEIDDIGLMRVYKNTSNTNAYMYFCKSGNRYDCSTASADIKDATQVAEYIANLVPANETKHVREADRDETNNPDCVNAGSIITYCFCGAKMGSTPIEATGHDYGKELSYNVWVWENDNYFENANYKHTCQICAEEYIGAVVANSYLFIEEGFATFANKEGETIKSYDFQYSIKVNTDAMDEYTKATGNVIKYGTVAGVGDSLTNPISYENGTLSVGESAAVSDMTGTDYVKLLIKVTSIPVLEEGVKITCNAYAIVDDKLRYVGETTVTENAQSSLIK